MGLQFEMQDVDDAPEFVDGQEFFAVCREIKGIQRPSFDDKSVMEDAIQWKFEILDPDGSHDKTWVWGRTSQVFSSSRKCKLRNWAIALLGQDLPSGYKLDTDDLLDQECKVVLQVKPPLSADRDPFVNVVQVKPLAPIESASLGEDAPF